MGDTGISWKQPFGGDNSIFNTPGQVFGGDNSIFRKPFGDHSPPDLGPAPTAPDPAQATTNALKSQLDTELNMRRSETLVTGGQGLLEAPQTQSAGQLLLGS